MPVPFREDGPHLVYEFDDPPIVHISEEGAVTYADEEAAPKRKRVDGDDEESARKRRASAGLKGSARTVSYCANLLHSPALGLPAVKHSEHLSLHGSAPGEGRSMKPRRWLPSASEAAA